MTKLITPNFKTYIARQFVKSFVGRERNFLSESISRYVEYNYVDPDYTDEFFVVIDNDQLEAADVGYFYMFASANTEWETATIPTTNTSIQEYHYDVYDDMLFGKRVTTSDVSYMVSRFDWVSNTVYQKYDHTDVNLHENNFYTVVYEGDAYHVFKCIDNNNGAPSTHMPSPFEYNTSSGAIVTANTVIATANYYYKTSDNYVWMYLYSVNRLDFEKFATATFMPLPVEVTESPPPIGSIETIIVESIGAYHIGHNNGTIKKTNVYGKNLTYWLNVTGTDMFSYIDFYKGSAIYITDGRGAGQIRTITSSSIVLGERQITVDTPFDIELDASSTFDISPAVVINGNGYNATARAIINANNQLQQIEMINSGYGYTDATVTVNTNTGYFDEYGVFVETTTTGTAKAIISPPRGHGRDLVNELYADKVCISVDFLGNNHPITPYCQYGIILDPLFSDIEITVPDSAGFLAGEVIIQPDNATYGVLDSIDANSHILHMKNVRGVFTSNSIITGLGSNTSVTSTSINKNTETYIASDLVEDSGEILLIKNDALITRNEAQTERLKLIIDFESCTWR